MLDVLTVNPAVGAESDIFGQCDEDAGVPVDHNQQYDQYEDQAHRGRMARAELGVVHELADPTQFQQPVEPESAHRFTDIHYCVDLLRIWACQVMLFR